MKKNNTLYNHLETAFSMTINELTEQLKSEVSTVVSKHHIIKNGKLREIYKVKRNSLTWRVQKFLNNFYFSKITLPECAYGFRKGKSYLDFLDYHVSNSMEISFLKLDIKDFFGSIKVDKLIESLTNKFEKDTTRKKMIQSFFLVALSFNDKIPQGFQTSPFLSNFYFLRADLRIQKYCDKLGFRYSRYVDDIIFSSENSDKLFSSRTISMIEEIIKDFHLKLNRQKTKKAKKEIALNGFIISSEIRLSQKKLKELRRVIFIIEQCKKGDNIVQRINLDKNVNPKNKKRNFTEEYLLNYLSGNRGVYNILCKFQNGIMKKNI